MGCEACVQGHVRETSGCPGMTCLTMLVCFRRIVHELGAGWSDEKLLDAKFLEQMREVASRVASDRWEW